MSSLLKVTIRKYSYENLLNLTPPLTCIVHKRNVIGFLSQNFHKKVQQYFNENYTVDNAVIDFVVLWHNKDTGENLKHPLCKIVLKK